MKYQAGGSGIHRPTKKAGGNFGDEYKAKKASGDVKKSGKPDPFAYLPLQKSALNKRKRAKMEGQFKGLVKATRKGAKTGKAKLAVRMKNLKV
jgi:ribosomal RNA-processing protein 12